MKINFSVLVATIVLALTSCGGDEKRSIEGIYSGSLRVIDEFNQDVLYETDASTVTIQDCNNSCIEVRFQTDVGSSITTGTYTEESGFYDLRLEPIYNKEEFEFTGMVPSWQEHFVDGTGSFDYDNNTMLINLQVGDDSGAGGSSNRAYFFEGSQN